MASSVEQLTNPETPSSAPVRTKQPSASKDSYYSPKEVTYPVWKIGFCCRKDQNYKQSGALVFCTNDKCKNSAKLPAGHKKEFPIYRKWKSGDSNQIMLVHRRTAHQDELSAQGAQKDISTLKTSSLQQKVNKLFQKNTIVVFNEAKQNEMNKAIVYNCVIHCKQPLSRFKLVRF